MIKHKEVNQLRAKIKQSGLSQRYLYKTLKLSQGWFRRMIMGEFHEPNPEWMKQLNDYLDDAIALKDKYR